MLKKLALSSAVALVLAAPAWAQTSSTTTSPRPSTSAAMPKSSEIDVHKLTAPSSNYGTSTAPSTGSAPATGSSTR